MIDRPDYIKRLFALKDKRPIKIITGVRRSGKSTLLELFQKELLKQGIKPKQIQSINLEDIGNEHFRDYRLLYNHVVKNIVQGKQNYVFLDEIQVVPEFGKVANSLYLKGNVDVYLTGSNSKIQSKHIANTIEREYMQIHLLPLSFREYLSAWQGSNLDDIYDDYLRYSSFPFILNFRESGKWDERSVNDYLTYIYEKIVLKDIVENKNISSISRLDAVIKFMADNISKETSVNNIANAMTSAGTKIDYKTVESYLEAFCNSFILYKIDRYDIKGKERLKTLNKYFLVDLGLRYLLLGKKKVDTGKILENIVYLELLRRGYKVYIGKIGNKEVDFVAEGLNGTEYYQVAETIRGDETFQRETTALEAIKDHNPKFILTRDYDTSSHNGIKIKNVLEWLI
jgi:predicted AAA+ superfamily ATPase